MTPTESRRRTVHAYRSARRWERNCAAILAMPLAALEWDLAEVRTSMARAARAACNLAAYYQTLPTRKATQ